MARNTLESKKINDIAGVAKPPAAQPFQETWVAKRDRETAQQSNPKSIADIAGATPPPAAQPFQETWVEKRDREAAQQANPRSITGIAGTTKPPAAQPFQETWVAKRDRETAQQSNPKSIADIAGATPPPAAQPFQETWVEKRDREAAQQANPRSITGIAGTTKPPAAQPFQETLVEKRDREAAQLSNPRSITASVSAPPAVDNKPIYALPTQQNTGSGSIILTSGPGKGKRLDATGPATGGFAISETNRQNNLAIQQQNEADAETIAFNRNRRGITDMLKQETDRNASIADAAPSWAVANPNAPGASDAIARHTALQNAGTIRTEGLRQQLGISDIDMKSRDLIAGQKAGVASHKLAADATVKVADLTASGREKAAIAAHQTDPLADRDKLQTKRDIATRLREAQRSYSTAIKLGDPDQIATAIDLIDALNVDAEGYGVQPLPVPKRPMTSEEGTVLRTQAIKNLKANRSRIGAFFNSSPSSTDIAAEIQRLKTEAGSNVSPAEKPGSGPAGFDAMPTAGQHSGRILRDTETGKRYRSSGLTWVEVR